MSTRPGVRSYDGRGGRRDTTGAGARTFLSRPPVAGGMEYTTLGDTGTTVSRICLGCMSFGTSDWREWVLDEAESLPIIERALDLGINFFDITRTQRVLVSCRT